jgi:hypothetical protein
MSHDFAAKVAPRAKRPVCGFWAKTPVPEQLNADCRLSSRRKLPAGHMTPKNVAECIRFREAAINWAPGA